MNEDMKLPEGKKCLDCRHFDRCFNLFGCKSGNAYCDFSPSRFAPEPDDE